MMALLLRHVSTGITVARRIHWAMLLDTGIWLSRDSCQQIDRIWRYNHPRKKHGHFENWKGSCWYWSRLRHHIVDTFLLLACAWGIHRFSGLGTVMRAFVFFFVVILNKFQNKQSNRRRFETPRSPSDVSVNVMFQVETAPKNLSPWLQRNFGQWSRIKSFMAWRTRKILTSFRNWRKSNTRVRLFFKPAPIFLSLWDGCIVI